MNWYYSLRVVDPVLLELLRGWGLKVPGEREALLEFNNSLSLCDGTVKSPVLRTFYSPVHKLDGTVKGAKIKACESLGMRRTVRYVAVTEDEAQRRDWTSNEVFFSAEVNEPGVRLFFGYFLIVHLAIDADMDDYLGFTSPNPTRF